MHPKIDWIEKRKTIRATAESLLPDQVTVLPASQPTEILLNELLIHKIELEVQIDELKRANLAMEESRDRYLDLYDRSPVGYITLNRDGLMMEMNVKACELLDVERSSMQHERFSSHVALSDRDKWHVFFLKIMEQSSADSHALSLNLIRTDGSVFHAHSDCQRSMGPSLTPTMRLTVLDLSRLVGLDQFKRPA